MEAKIGRALLTTESSYSSYGMPVLILDGQAYGPDDLIDGFLVGSHVVTVLAGETTVDPDTLEAALKFVSQSPANRERWSAMLRVLPETADRMEAF